MKERKSDKYKHNNEKEERKFLLDETANFDIRKSMFDFKNFSLRQRIRFSFIISIVLIAIIGLVSFHQLNQAMQEVQILLALKAQVGDEQASDQTQQLETVKAATLHAKFILILTMVLTLGGGLTIGWIAPHYTVFPLDRFLVAIKHAQQGELETTQISYTGDKEFVEIANQLNLFFKDLHVFEKIRAERVYFARETVEVMANLIDDLILMIDAQTRQVLFLNHQAYNTFNVTSDRSLDKVVDRSGLPEKISQAVIKAIEKEEKVACDVKISKKYENADGTEITEEIPYKLTTALIWSKDRRNLKRVVARLQESLKTENIELTTVSDQKAEER